MGYRAMQRGQRVYTPGIMNWAMAQSMRFTPRNLATKVVKHLSKPVVRGSNPDQQHEQLFQRGKAQESVVYCRRSGGYGIAAWLWMNGHRLLFCSGTTLLQVLALGWSCRRRSRWRWIYLPKLGALIIYLRFMKFQFEVTSFRARVSAGSAGQGLPDTREYQRLRAGNDNYSDAGALPQSGNPLVLPFRGDGRIEPHPFF